MKKALLLLALISLSCISYASLIWQFSTDGPVSAKPLVYQGMAVVLSDDGNAYALDAATGAKKWQVEVGRTPNDALIFDNAVVVSASNGKVVKIGAAGNKVWELNLNTTAHNVSRVYGASANQNYIFVTADNGVYEVNRDGAVLLKLAAYSDSILTAPAAGTGYVVYGKGKDLIKLNERGDVQWTTALPSGSFWLSRPVIEGNAIYVGALDGRMHAFSTGNGDEMWVGTTGSWVLGTPLVDGGAVYFGSDDAKVYAVDIGSGESRWAAQMQLAVKTEPEPGTMGGKSVIFAGGSDGSIYAIETDKGEIVWKGSAGGAVGSPLFHQNSVIFGSADGKVYAYSSESACSITNPYEADIIGLKEVAVTGKYVSSADTDAVYVRINGGDWAPAETGEVDWVYYVDPQSVLNPGLNIISCKVGDETSDVYTGVAVNQDPQIPLSDLMITVSPGIVEKKQFTVFVNDGDDGSPVDRFMLTFQGKGYNGSKNVTLTASDAGTFQVVVKKAGFNDAGVNVVVNASGMNPVYLVGGILLILAILYLVWERGLKQKFARKR